MGIYQVCVPSKNGMASGLIRKSQQPLSPSPLWLTPKRPWCLTSVLSGELTCIICLAHRVSGQKRRIIPKPEGLWLKQWARQWLSMAHVYSCSPFTQSFLFSFCYDHPKSPWRTCWIPALFGWIPVRSTSSFGEILEVSVIRKDYQIDQPTRYQYLVYGSPQFLVDSPAFLWSPRR